MNPFLIMPNLNNIYYNCGVTLRLRTWQTYMCHALSCFTMRPCFWRVSAPVRPWICPGVTQAREHSTFGPCVLFVLSRWLKCFDGNLWHFPWEYNSYLKLWVYIIHSKPALCKHYRGMFRFTVYAQCKYIIMFYILQNIWHIALIVIPS